MSSKCGNGITRTIRLWCGPALLLCMLGAASGEDGSTQLTADWPMWRHDATRSAATPQELPSELHLRWVRHLPKLEPAWPEKRQMDFDTYYKPIVLGRTLFVASPRDDSLLALDVDSGEEKWRFFADGPIRLAPAAWRGKVYFAGDDGFLYCVNATDGKLLWKFRGAPSGRKCIGNERLISGWPARGGPVVADGRVYFASGIWSFMGIFIHALDAETGRVLWTNGETGYLGNSAGHVSPKGHLVIIDDKLIVPGNPWGVLLDRQTGKTLSIISRPSSWPMWGGGSLLVAKGKVYDVMSGKPSTLGIKTEGKWTALIHWYTPAPLIEGHTAFLTPGNSVQMVDVKNPAREQVKTKRSTIQRFTAPVVKQFPVHARVNLKLYKLGLAMKAGSRLYTVSSRTVWHVLIPEDGQKSEISKLVEIEGQIAEILAADDKLFVVAREGAIYCFGPEKTKPLKHVVAQPAAPAPADEWTRTADELLQACKAQDGYCVVFGVGNGRLLEELARRSTMPVVGVDPDARLAAAARRRLHAADLYGTRACVLVGDPLSIELSPYLASLLVAVKPRVAAQRPALLKQLGRWLRPYGGTACLPVPESEHAALNRAISECGPANATLKCSGRYAVLTRGALPDAAEWTHDDADAGQTMASRDKLVKAPLGVLWFGGPSSNLRYLDRHSGGPRPHLAGGRLFTCGPNMLHGTDTYTGRVLWKKALPGFSSSFGAQGQFGVIGKGRLGKLTGGNYASAGDAVYVACGMHCLRLDSATGKETGRYAIPKRNGEASMNWGYVGLLDDVLIGCGVSPFFSRDDDRFTPGQLAGKDAKALTALEGKLRKLNGFDIQPRPDAEPQVDFVVKTLNRLLDERDLAAKFGKRNLRWHEAKRMNQLRGKIKAHNEAEARGDGPDLRLRSLNRQSLELYLSVPRKWVDVDVPAIWSRRAGTRLAAFNRHNGNLLWSRDSVHVFGNRMIALGSGKVFCADGPNAPVIRAAKRRGEKTTAKSRLLALDLQTGKVLWSVDQDSSAGKMVYSSEHDVLLGQGNLGPDKRGRSGTSTVAYRGKDGTKLWQGGAMPAIMVRGSTIIQGFGNAKDLMTGAPQPIINPITGTRMLWSGGRYGKGCGDVIAGHHLLLFRAFSQGYYDLERHSGSSYLPGFRPACYTSSIPGCGVLGVPHYSQACGCVPRSTSIGLIHMPELETWHIYATKPMLKKYYHGTIPIQHLAVNLGAPGDRCSADGALWLNYKSSKAKDEATVQDPFLGPLLKIEPGQAEYFRNHSSCMSEKRLNWIGASGVTGLESVQISLGADAAKTPYTVRLYLAEPEQSAASGRVFSVTIQGQEVLKDFSVAGTARGPRKTIMREFKGITVKDKLLLTFRKAANAKLPPVLNGIELIAEAANADATPTPK